MNRAEEIKSVLGDILLELRITDSCRDITGMVLLGKNGVMDSLTAMGFIDRVENRFGVDITGDLNLDCMENIGALIEFIDKHSGFAENSGLQSSSVTVGRHLIMDCGNISPPSHLSDIEKIRSLIGALAQTIGTRILKEEYHRFSPAGVTGFAIVSASHIAVHTWPEHGYMGIDIFSCKEVDAEAARGTVTDFFTGASCVFRVLERRADTDNGAGIRGNR